EAHDELDLRLGIFSQELAQAESQLNKWRAAAALATTRFDEELASAQLSIATRIAAVHTDAATALADSVKAAVAPLIEELNAITTLARKMRTSVAALERATT